MTVGGAAEVWGGNNFRNLDAGICNTIKAYGAYVLFDTTKAATWNIQYSLHRTPQLSCRTAALWLSMTAKF